MNIKLVLSYMLNFHVKMNKYLLLMIFIYFLFLTILFAFGATAPQWARDYSFTRFLDHTQRRTRVGRTPLGEWSARHRGLYMITHNTHNKHPCPRLDTNPWSQQASGRKPTPLKDLPRQAKVVQRILD